MAKQNYPKTLIKFVWATHPFKQQVEVHRKAFYKYQVLAPMQRQIGCSDVAGIIQPFVFKGLSSFFLASSELFRAKYFQYIPVPPSYLQAIGETIWQNPQGLHYNLAQ
jgi:hypothetical protein